MLRPFGNPPEWQAPRRVLVQIRVPGSDQRDAEATAGQHAHETDIAWTGEVQHVWRKRAKLTQDPAEMSSQQQVELQIVFDIERGVPRPFQLEPDDRTFVGKRGCRAGVHGQERQVTALRVAFERARWASDAVRLIVRVTEQRNLKSPHAPDLDGSLNRSSPDAPSASIPNTSHQSHH